MFLCNRLKSFVSFTNLSLISTFQMSITSAGRKKRMRHSKLQDKIDSSSSDEENEIVEKKRPKFKKFKKVSGDTEDSDKTGMKSKLEEMKRAMALVKQNLEEEKSDENEEDSKDESEENSGMSEGSEKNSESEQEVDESKQSENDDDEEEETDDDDNEDDEVESESNDDEQNDDIQMSAIEKSIENADDYTSVSREDIRSELTKMSLEEIQRLKERIGLKLFNNLTSKGPKKPSKESSSEKTERTIIKRENRHRPREISSKVKVSRFRDVVGVASEVRSKIKDRRDPRFETASGDFDKKEFADNYKFVDDIKRNERKQLVRELKEETDPERIKKIQYLIQRYDNQFREKKKHAEKSLKKTEEKRQLAEMKASGQKPVFKSRAEEKDRDLVAQFEDLKKRGKLDKYLKKKNKKANF